MIATALRRYRNTHQASYCTHGGDTYDHKARRKAGRRLAVAMVAEQLADINREPPKKVVPFVPELFRLVLVTQYMENYGDADDQYWKYKGGSEYSRLIGTVDDVLALGKAGIKALEQELCRKIEQRSDYIEEYVLYSDVVSIRDETDDERMDAGLAADGYMSVAEVQDRCNRRQV